ncbi:centromere protein Q isoform X2 [Peromyscus leucopus]|uniref:centromere protein Q isoform X2 n=1 Tax=Peromyscus leucopus TaxID=10041 RepID=UPI0018856844|nr:centromere protein Q isoform X2 [Peromyscus leucopus]
MPGKANASKRKSQQLKRNSKQRTDEVDFPENEVGNTAKRNKSHAGHLSSKATGQAKSINLKRIKVASNKRKTWQPLPKNTEEYLQSMMESVILEILTKNIKGKEQIQCHLNYLKKRLLQQCGTLKVPPRKLNYLTDVSNLLKMERAQERAHEEDLALLQIQRQMSLQEARENTETKRRPCQATGKRHSAITRNAIKNLNRQGRNLYNFGFFETRFYSSKAVLKTPDLPAPVFTCCGWKHVSPCPACP